ncbi:Uncharacterized protein family UPF0220 [Cynara cardunculus var. scolymus]|uniref:Uncharacterized protein family UPF0220 n=1 Tax=Cynara cardunculus var. scolymus TaxID=59895 RepID=A0A124SE86_CYNCS|nr:Uncharacterized protein family UPF0220 [Cynara cardunculus var. scolymus]
MDERQMVLHGEVDPRVEKPKDSEARESELKKNVRPSGLTSSTYATGTNASHVLVKLQRSTVDSDIDRSIDDCRQLIHKPFPQFLVLFSIVESCDSTHLRNPTRRSGINPWIYLNCGEYSGQALPAPFLEPAGGFGSTLSFAVLLKSRFSTIFLFDLFWGYGLLLVGIFASLAALMFNCVRREDIDYSPYEEGEWRLKLWLFLAYVVSFVSLAASVGLLIQDALVPEGPSAWAGTAGVLQCVLVLIR